jgi:RNA polymerase sigma-70 factor (ECF subfamily)
MDYEYLSAYWTRSTPFLRAYIMSLHCYNQLPDGSADDVLQHVGLVFFKEFPTRYEEHLWWGCLRATAHNRTYDLIRKQGYRSSSNQPLESVPPELLTRAGHEKQVEAILLVDHAMKALNPQERTIVWLVNDGMTHPEIAERLGLPLTTVQTKYRRALQKGRRALIDKKTTSPVQKSLPISSK